MDGAAVLARGLQLVRRIRGRPAGGDHRDAPPAPSAHATIAAATPALAIGHAIGRIGCLLVGDDYGIPSTLPWAIAFPQGLPPTDVPVHPTQIYEAVALLPIAVLLFRMRQRGAPARTVVGAYLVLTATTRFVIQWIRVYEPVVGPLGFAHLAAVPAIGAGLYLLLVPGGPPLANPRGVTRS